MDPPQEHSFVADCQGKKQKTWKTKHLSFSSGHLEIHTQGKKKPKKLDLHEIYSFILPAKALEKVDPGSFDPAKTTYFCLTGPHKLHSAKIYAMPSDSYKNFFTQLLTGKQQLALAKSASYLLLSVSAGANLPICDVSSSDPFVEAYFENHSGKHLGDKFSTFVCHSTLFPYWGEQLVALPLPDGATKLRIKVYDSDGPLKSDFMGEVSFDVGEIPSDIYVKPRWFPLECPEKEFAALKVGFYFVASAGRILEAKEAKALTGQALTESKLSEKKATSKMLLKKHKEGLDAIPAGELKIQIEYAPPVGEWDASVALTFLEGRNLIAKDPGGTSDPFIRCYLGKTKPKHCQKSDWIKKTLNPVWTQNNVFVMHVSPEKIKHIEDQVITVEVWDYDVSSGSDSMGGLMLHLAGCTFDSEEWHKVKYLPTSMPVMTDASVGKKHAAEGWAPDFPIFLIPGFASSALECVSSSHSGWRDERIWLNINGLLGSKLGELSASSRKIKKAAKKAAKEIREAENMAELKELANQAKDAAIKSAENVYDDVAYSTSNAMAAIGLANQWVNHLCLLPDCKTDPEGIQVRAVAGFDGCMYLQTGKIGKHLAYVLGPVVENLEAIGYKKKGPDQNLFAFPYDWRVPPEYLEERDGYFTILKKSLEESLTRHGKPAALIGHSMGNRMIQYFCNWVFDQEGKAWLDKHVHAHLAVGAPWLGAPKMIRALITGERMGLDALLTVKDSVTFARRVGTTMFLLPEGEQFYHDNMRLVNLPSAAFVFVNRGSKEEHTGFSIASKSGHKHYFPATFSEIMNEAKAADVLERYQNYYLTNPFFGSAEATLLERTKMRILQPHAIQRLYNIYGVNMDTEKYYFYKVSDTKWTIDTAATAEIEGHITHDGFVFETDDTPQASLKNAGFTNYLRSGDGTVTYESLSYPKYAWKGAFDEYKHFEIAHAEHRDTISTARCYEIIVQLVCKKDPAKVSKVRVSSGFRSSSPVSRSQSKQIQKATDSKSLQKLKRKLAKKGSDPNTLKEVQHMWELVDTDHNGQLDLVESKLFFDSIYDWFKKSSKKEKDLSQEEAQARKDAAVIQWIRDFDQDNSGTISKQEFLDGIAELFGKST